MRDDVLRAELRRVEREFEARGTEEARKICEEVRRNMLRVAAGRSVGASEYMRIGERRVER